MKKRFEVSLTKKNYQKLIGRTNFLSSNRTNIILLCIFLYQDSELSEDRINEQLEKIKEDNEKAQNFVKQKLELQEKLNQTMARIEAQDKKIQEIKFKIEELELEISKMKSKKQELATRLDVAQINNEINETLSGLSDDYGINLDELEKKVQEKESYGKALEDMKPKSEDAILDEYINDSPIVDSKIEDELERIKNEMNR